VRFIFRRPMHDRSTIASNKNIFLTLSVEHRLNFCRVQKAIVATLLLQLCSMTSPVRNGTVQCTRGWHDAVCLRLHAINDQARTDLKTTKIAIHF